jgi:hypothetical protein
MQRNSIYAFCTSHLSALFALDIVQKTKRTLTNADAADARRIIAETAQALGTKLAPELLKRIKSGLEYVIIHGDNPLLLSAFNAELRKRFGKDAPIYGICTGFYTQKLATIKPAHIVRCAKLHGFSELEKEASAENLSAEKIVALAQEYKRKTLPFRLFAHTVFSMKPAVMRGNLAQFAIAGIKLTSDESGALVIPSEYGKRTSNANAYAVFPDLLPDAARVTAEALAHKQAEKTEKKKTAAKKTAAKKTAAKKTVKKS